MSWNAQGGGPRRTGPQGPWGQGPMGGGSIPPDLEEAMRRIQARLRGLFGGGGGASGGRSFAALAVVALAVWGLSGLYTVQPNEVGLKMMFGRYIGKTGPGLGYNWPTPIGSVEKLGVTDRNTTTIGFVSRVDPRADSPTHVDVPEESLMLTGDLNIADVKFVVIWQIDPAKPEDYAFNVRRQPQTVKAVAESAMREIVGRTDIQRILTAERKVIEPATQDLMQSILDEYRAGVKIIQVQLQSVDPPDQVIAAYRDVTAAQQDLDRMRNEADTHANQVVPEARGAAARIVQESQAYREQIVAEARGQTARFNQIYEEYHKAPGVTRERMYLETMERVLGAMNKVIVDPQAGTGVVPYLPLGGLDAAKAAPRAGGAP